MQRFHLTLLFLCIAVFSNAQSVGDFQTAASGGWSTLATWQTWNGTAWVAATAYPTSADGNITILATHTVTLNVGAINIDQVVVNGTLQTGTTAATGSFTVANGAGTDLIINGTFLDQLTTGVITWTGNWEFGTNGTLIKTSASSSNNWQTAYNGGASTMPSTANWILRKVGAANPALSTIGAYYPNLTIESNVTTSLWTTTSASSSFTGNSGFATIKGNLDIGGSGTGKVNFLDDNTFATPILVMGNTTIRTGCYLRNFGTGFELQGDLTVSGMIYYDANDTRRLTFSGANNQTISGSGLLYVYDMTINKSSGNVTLNTPATIDNLLTLTSGQIVTTSTNVLIMGSSSSVAGTSNSSFVNGPVRYMGTNAFTYPVGKSGDYQAIGIGGYTHTSGVFWSDNFNNGCSSNCNASSYSGSNGAWTTTTFAGHTGSFPNIWYVSCAENGHTTNICGSGCTGAAPTATLASLHIGASLLSDGGASYYAANGGQSEIRAESPTINCTGKTGITLSFNYIEFGQGTTDNGTVWYYDGSSWSQLSDPAKTFCCGGITCTGTLQGLWTYYSIALPASADNNPNVKIGFKWINNGDNVGTDPSFAIDDVTLFTTIEYFTAEYFYVNPQTVYNNNLAPTLSAIDACAYWVLDRTPLTSTAATAVTLTWDGNSCITIPQLSDTRVAHFDGSTWQDEGNGGNTGSTTAGTVTSAAPVTYFSPFTVAVIPPVVLPIELLNFSGACGEGGVDLAWTTATELNNDYFTIERSTDGIHFIAIAQIDGAGTTDQLSEYHFTDAGAARGMNYYRLRQTDFNGVFSLSKPIAVDAAACGNSGLFLANAWSDNNTLDVSYTSALATVTIDVYSPTGALVYHETGLPENGHRLIDENEWSAGLYIVRISDGYTSVSRTVLK